MSACSHESRETFADIACLHEGLLDFVSTVAWLTNLTYAGVCEGVCDDAVLHEVIGKTNSRGKVY